MNYEIKNELHKLLFDEEKNIENFNLIHELYQQTARYLQNFPFVKYPFPGYEAFEFLCYKYQFNTVLDIGCGEGY